jgi:Domain of unknown function (DUF1929)
VWTLSTHDFARRALVFQSERRAARRSRFVAIDASPSTHGDCIVSEPLTNPRQYTTHVVSQIVGSRARSIEFGYEFYLPSYVGATRPLITEAPSAVEYGASFEITTPDAARIESVVMLSASSITHHTDAGGRYVQLRIDHRSDDRIRVRAPTSAGVLAPGNHMIARAFALIPSARKRIDFRDAAFCDSFARRSVVSFVQTRSPRSSRLS